MLKGKWDVFDKVNSRKIAVGYDLGDEYSQISYCTSPEEEPETLSMVAGEENYNIPTVLCKRKGVNQWYYGKEAVKYSEEEGVVLLDKLVSRALSGEEVTVEGMAFHPVALLTLFIKRSLGLLSLTAGTDRIGALMITCQKLDTEMVDILNRVIDGLMLKTDCICFQSHIESIYYYLLYHSEDLCASQIAVYDYSGTDIRVQRAECNRNTTPMVVFIHRDEYCREKVSGLSEAEQDEVLKELAERVCSEHPVEISYLIGDGFREEWMKEALKVLCRNRRVFLGNNLYSKGACYGIREKISVSETGKQYIFLGEEKLKSNIGIQGFKQGEPFYHALLDAGVNWYEAEAECEFYLESGNSFELTVTPLDGKKISTVSVVLEGLPERQNTATRLSVKLNMPEKGKMRVTVEDLGFGEIVPASGFTWNKDIPVD